MFQPNSSEKHMQPILQDDAKVLQAVRDCLDAILKDNFQSIVSKSPTDIGRTKLFKMYIFIKGPSIACRPYAIPLKYQKFVNEEIKLLEATGCISKSLSLWAAPIIKVPTKSGSNHPNKPLLQMVLDYRKLNKAINSAHNSDKIVSHYPVLNISDLLAKFGNCRIFLSLDLCSGYHHIGIKPEARPKTVFTTMSGKWHWNITPFGICSLPRIFSYLLSEVLKVLTVV